MTDEDFNRACDATYDRLKASHGTENADAMIKSIGDLARSRGVAIGRDELESLVTATDAPERLAEVGRAAVASLDTPEADRAWSKIRQAEREQHAAYKGRGRR